MLRRVAIAFLVLACIWALASCGGGSKTASSGVIAQLPMQNGAADSGTKPEDSGGGREDSGPIPSIGELDRLITNPRRASQEPTVVSLGSEAFENGLTGTNGSSPYNIEADGTALTLRAYAIGEYSYAVYAQELEPTMKPKLTRISCLPCDYGGSGAGSDEPIPLCHYIGFADYSLGSWRWFGPFSAVDGEVEVHSGTLKTRFISPSNRCYICVLASNGSKATSALPADGLVADFPLEEDARDTSQAAEDPGGLTIVSVTTWVEKGLLTAPAMVTGLKSSYWYSSVWLIWNANDDSDVDYYEVFRDDRNDDTPRELLAEVAAPRISYADEAGIPAKYYRYWVRAHNAVGYGGESRLDAAGKLVAPVIAASGDLSDRIRLSWTPGPGGLKYFLYRSDARDGTYELVKEFSPEEQSYDDPETPMNEWRYYRMEVQGEDLDSAPGEIARGMRTHDPLEWAHTWEAGVYGAATGVGVDSSGSACVVGYSQLPVPKHYEAVALKYSFEGELFWERTWGGPTDDFAEAVAVDQYGSTYVAGRTASFGAGASDCFLLKYDSSGELLWQKTWGGPQNDRGYGVALDETGDLYVAGSTGSYGAGKSDVLLLKYDINGNLLWQKAWGGAGSDEARGIAVGSGFIWITGITESFGAGDGDVLLLQLDDEGNVQWARAWGTESDETANGVALDSAGNAYVVGTDYICSILFLKYDPHGNLLHQFAWATGGLVEGNGIAVDESGADTNVFVTGLGGAGSFSVCLLRYSADGDLLTQKAWYGPIAPYVNTGNALVATHDGVTYLCGVGDPGVSTFFYSDGSVTIPSALDTLAAGTLSICTGVDSVPAGIQGFPTGSQDTGGLLLIRLDSGKI